MKHLLEWENFEYSDNLNEGKYFDEIKHHYDNSDFVILTSWRDNNDLDVNKKNLKELKSTLKSMNYKFLEIDGMGQEEDENNEIKVVSEPSLFVINTDDDSTSEFESNMFKLAKKYSQWGVVAHNQIDGTRLIETMGKGTKVDMKFSKLVKGKSQFYSSYKGEAFYFA